MIKLSTSIIVILNILFSIGLSAGTVALKELTENDKSILEVENFSFRMKICPAQGGRVVGFYNKTANLEMVAGRGQGWGMFADMFSQEKYPGELQKNPYEIKILNRGPETVSIMLSRMVSGQWDGYFPSIAGIRVEKTYTVKADSPNLYVNYRLVNTENTGKSPAFWIQSFFSAGVDTQKNVYFRPSARGVDITFFNFKDATGIRPDDVRDPVAGWVAAVNKESKTGLLFLLDYNYLRWLYNCQSACTTEWFYDKVIIPGGKCWETNIVCVPLVNMEGVAYVSDKLILQASPDKNKIDFKVRAIDGEIPGLDLTASVKGINDETLSEPATIKFSTVTVNPETQSIKTGKEINPGECVIPFQLKSEGINQHSEVVYSSKDIFVAMFGLGGDQMYRMPVPEKQKNFLKPEKIERHKSIPPRALLLNGVYHRMYKAGEAVDLLGWDKNIGKAAKGEWSGLSLSFWPEDYDRLMAYDIVILSNVNAEAIGNEGVEMLREYVYNGGALLVMGGSSAFDPEISTTGLDKILPVEYQGSANLILLKDAKFRLADDNKKLTAQLNSSVTPSCFWLHDLKPKKDSEVILYAGDKPLMVMGNYGKGKVAVFLGSTLGSGGTGVLPFWEWKEWPAYLSGIIKKLSIQTKDQ